MYKARPAMVAMVTSVLIASEREWNGCHYHYRYRYYNRYRCRRFFEVAPGSVMECAAIQECLTACKVLGTYQNTAGKAMLSRMVSMLIKLGRRNHEFREDTLSYGNYDCDNGNNNDNEFQPRSSLREGIETRSTHHQLACLSQVMQEDDLL